MQPWMSSEKRTVDAHHRHHLQGAGAELVRLAFDQHLRPARLHVQELDQVRVAVGLDLPVVQAAPGGDRLAVQQIRGRPGGFAIQLEDRYRQRGLSHGAILEKSMNAHGNCLLSCAPPTKNADAR